MPEATRTRSEAKSRKPPIVEYLFDQRWDPETRVLRDPVVMADEVQEAISRYNESHKGDPKKRLSTKNPANFLKDLVRNKESANANWPERIFKAGYTARQLTGGGLSFEFIRVPEGQDTPFVPLLPTEDTPRHRCQSVSMPLASRRLGRPDESWLAQVLVRLNVVEMHLALESKRKFVQLDHLQTGVKLGRAEVDSLYLGHEVVDEEGEQGVMVFLEAKTGRDSIDEEQILRQIAALFNMSGMTQGVVIPMAAKVVGPGEIFLVEFLAVTRTDYRRIADLTVASTAVYQLHPRVPGIG